MHAKTAKNLLLLLPLLPLLASPATAQLTTLETESLRLVYEGSTQSFLAPHVARCFENSLRFHRELFDYRPTEKITVILNDFADFGHGAATANPRNALLVSIAPMSLAFETYPSNERMNTLMNHELVHIAALDRSAGIDRFFRTLFGGKVQETADHPESILYSYLTTPRKASPRWYHEGIAVFVETWMAGGVGRAQGAYDEMVFRSMVRDDTHFYDPLGLASEGKKVGFQGGALSYLYGTRFLSYLAHEYSPESLIEWVSRSSQSRRYFAAQFRKVYGISLGQAWSEWIEWERSFQQTNLDAIRTYPITPFRKISDRALGSVSRPHYDPDAQTIYVALNYPGAVAHVAAISTVDGTVRKICDVKGPQAHVVTSLAFDPIDKQLFYTQDHYAWRDLCSIDLATGKSKMLLRDLRVGELVFDETDRSLYGVRHFNGISTLVRVPFPYEEWEQIHSWPYGQGIYDIDVSPDGEWLSASVAEISGRQTLRVMNLAALAEGDTTSSATYEFATSVPSNFVFSPDGKSLYGSSYYSGVSNIFRCGVMRDTLEAVSNCETGLFRPIPLDGDSLIAFSYTGEGFVPGVIEALPLEDINPISFLGQRITEKHPVVTRWKVGSPAAIDLDSLTTANGGYDGVGNIGHETFYPIVEGYKDFAAYGLRVNFSDPLFLHRLGLSASYSPEEGVPGDERLHLEFTYRRYDLSFFAHLNEANFYDLFGPTKTSRKGYGVGIQYKRSLIYDEPRTLEYSVSGAFYGGLERLPDYQNVRSSFEELVTGSARLSYRNKKFSLGAVDYEKGIDWDLVVSGNFVTEKVYPQFLGKIDVGRPLFRHSSLWLRTSAGLSPGDRNEPFANFFFGGFGNNWIDHQEPKRYRAHYSFPGLELNELGGRNFAKALLEWNLPPLRFRRLGTPSFYATWARAAIFSSGIVTNLDFEPRRKSAVNVGAQIDVRLTLLSNQSLTASAGYAVAFREDQKNAEEFMFSLKIL